MSVMSQYSHLLPELRAAVKNDLTDVFDNDFTLLHWLDTFKGDMDRMVPKLTSHLKLRKVMHLDAPDLKENYSAICNALEKYCPRNKCQGQVDKKGNVLDIDRLGLMDPKIMERVMQSDFLKFQIVRGELSRRRLLEHEMREDRSLGYVLIYDLGDLNIGALGMDAVSGGFARMTGIIGDNFPGVTKYALVVNASSMIGSIWAVVKLLLSVEIAEKARFLSSNFKTEILEFFDKDQLPVAYGGTLTSDDPDYMDTMVRPPQPLPSDIIPCSVEYKPSEFLNTYVSPSHSVFFDVAVSTGQMIQMKWFFEANGDLDYTAYFVPTPITTDQSQVPIIPKFRLTTNFLPEIGKFFYNATESGVISFEIENQSGYFMSTHLKYSVVAWEIDQPDEDVPLEVSLREDN